MRNFEECWNDYILLLEDSPELFNASSDLAIELDKNIAKKYHKETGVLLGVVYRSKFNQLIVDLIRDNKNNSYYTYERFEPTIYTNGVISVPILSNNKFLLLRQYRHAMRDYDLAFPRGYGELGLTSEENIKKEINEEIVSDTEKIIYLGTVSPDSGITSRKADVYMCHIDKYSNSKTEGIDNVLEYTEDDIDNMLIRKEITDGFTISAFCLYKLYKEKINKILIKGEIIC